VPPGAEQADEALSVERSSTVRRALNEMRQEVDAGRISRDEAAAQVTALVEALGLQPVDQGEPLEMITEDDVGVVCWIAVVDTDESPIELNLLGRCSCQSAESDEAAHLLKFSPKRRLWTEALPRGYWPLGASSEF
jgi:hypothetical protein